MQGWQVATRLAQAAISDLKLRIQGVHRVLRAGLESVPPTWSQKEKLAREQRETRGFHAGLAASAAHDRDELKIVAVGMQRKRGAALVGVVRDPKRLDVCSEQGHRIRRCE